MGIIRSYKKNRRVTNAQITSATISELVELKFLFEYDISDIDKRILAMESANLKNPGSIDKKILSKIKDAQKIKSIFYHKVQDQIGKIKKRQCEIEAQLFFIDQAITDVVGPDAKNKIMERASFLKEQSCK